MTSSDLFVGPVAAIGSIFLFLLGLVLCVIWILFPIRAIKRLDTLIAINKRISEHLSELNGRVSKLAALQTVRPNTPPVDQPDDLPEGMAKCECFHCGARILFEKANYDPNNAVVDCPNCGKKTKIFIPIPIPQRGI